MPLPLILWSSAVDYLEGLKINVERSADLAHFMVEEKEETNAYFLNCKSRIKEFKKCDFIQLLIPGFNDNWYARLSGPGEILENKTQRNQWNTINKTTFV